MALITVETSEPSSFRAGDTVKWDRVWSKYPASTHALTYFFRHDEGTVKKDILTTESGDTFQVRLTDQDTDSFIPGVWTWYAQITETSSNDRKTVASGRLKVVPAADADASKTHAQIMIELLEKALQSKISAGHESTTIGSTSLSKMTFADRRDLLEKYRVERENELRRERIRRGGKSGLTGQVRFA